MGWLIALGLLILFAALPLGVRILYNADGLLGYLILGPVHLRIFPMGKKEKKEKAEAPKKQTPVEKKPKEQKSKDGGSVKDFLPLVQTGLRFLNDFRKKLRVNRLELKLILAGGDPCDLAVNYGRAWTALGNLMPRLEQFLVIKKRDLEVECDFTADQTRVIARVELTVTLGRLLWLAVWYGVRALREYMKIMNKRKGGAKI